MTRIELDDGKYTVVHDSGAGLHALRYGEHWRDMTGDGLVLAMAQEIEDLRRRIVPVQRVSVPDGFRVMNPTSAVVRDGDRWEIYAPCGSGGIVNEADVTDWVVGKLLDAIAAAPAAPAADASDVLEQAMYTLISIGYHENSGLVHELRQALAAHRAKGVV